MSDEEIHEAELPSEFELHGARGPLKVRFSVTGSLAARSGLKYAGADDDREVVYAAALWYAAGSIRANVRPRSKRGDLGRAVLDWLLEEGVPFLEVLRAGEIAWLHCIRGLPDQEAARATAGFSAPTTDGSTG
jgi:hypothetical protein